jgi:hypothetical protein
MKPRNCLLTLVFPRALEERVVSLVLRRGDLASGFSTSEVEGHGRNARLTGAVEKVRGRARRGQMKVVLNDVDAQELIAFLKAELARADIVYWLIPVTEFGSFL